MSMKQILEDIAHRGWQIAEFQVSDNWPDPFYAAIFGRPGVDKSRDGYVLRVHSDLHPAPDRAVKQAYGLALQEIGAS